MAVESKHFSVKSAQLSATRASPSSSSKLSSKSADLKSENLDNDLDTSRITSKDEEPSTDRGLTTEGSLKNKLFYLLGVALTVPTAIIIAMFAVYISGYRFTSANENGNLLRIAHSNFLDNAPDYLEKLLKNVPGNILFQVKTSDIKVFHDMDIALNAEIFKNPLQDLAKRWVQHLKSSKDLTGPLINPIYFSLCKSLEELIHEIADKSHHTKDELLKSDISGWHPCKKINWSTENFITISLEREYYFIMKLLNHFDPASQNTKPFDYQLRLINGKIENPHKIAEELYVWYCLLDDVLAHILPISDNTLDAYENTLQSFVLQTSKAGINEMEKIRTITHNTLQLILKVAELKKENPQNLLLQLEAFDRLKARSESINSFRDLTEEYNRYLGNHNSIIEHFPTKLAIPEMKEIKNNLSIIVPIALQRNVSGELIVDLLRAFNDFLIDLDNVSFDWLIQSKQLQNSTWTNAMIEVNIVETVETKWSDANITTYRVIKPKMFSALIEDEIGAPKHSIVEIISKLLELIISQLQQSRWTSGNDLTDSEQIISATVLISAIRSSLIYLEDQADYVSYDQFMNDSLSPFSNVSKGSKSLSGFVKRIGLIKDSFYFFRRQNEMSIDEALKMFRNLNKGSDYSEKLIVEAYKTYTTHFEQFMKQTIPDITKAVLAYKENYIFKKWTSKYKQEKVPTLLAGIAAVWSHMASKDVSGTGKYLKPHCIQVLCVLRLLSADHTEDGVAKHLAQVLTGQGKSLVLGMTATILALTGHNIQVVCYNEYLVKRDALDFQALFNTFGVQKSINYITYDSMVNLVINPIVKGSPVNLRSLVTSLLESETNVKIPSPQASQIQDNSVVLIDEVDVFFTKNYYGNNYNPAANPVIPGLDQIQEKIWNHVSNNKISDVQDIYTKVLTFIDSSEFENKQEFNKFYSKREPYDLLVHENNDLKQKSTTNNELFKDHLKQMINDAILVASKPNSHWKNFRLNSKGVITMKDNERFVSHVMQNYLNIFNYLRLKEQDFVSTIGDTKNYGYLNIPCGTLSYAMLPINFPLILGVTGTLTTLNQHEKAAIENMYNIRQSSVMPTFFGSSNIQFDPLVNFHHELTETRWMSEIFAKAQAAIGSKRAVIVFFQDDTFLEQFQSEYAGQFDRLNVLTENTDENQQEQLITEAGIAKTVTLATRGMGRGVDYKSSVAVEKNGGVHVIQTFFSVDVKEETQIRGRTARKDNKGSYELIVCEQHLKQQKLLKDGIFFRTKVTYSTMDAERTKISIDESKNVAEHIKEALKFHYITLTYLQSFFE